jgi:hypothetical protein
MQSSQMCVQRRWGSDYTQQEDKQGSRQYLQPFAGCNHILILKVITAVAANRDVTISIPKEIPTKIKAGGQAILTEHPVTGARFLSDSF